MFKVQERDRTKNSNKRGPWSGWEDTDTNGAFEEEADAVWVAKSLAKDWGNTLVSVAEFRVVPA